MKNLLPHSVNLNCMSANDQLYISCAWCDGKYWSGIALENPEGRIRINEKVYPVTLVRLKDPARLDEAWRARAAKLGPDADVPRPDHWWSFWLRSR